ncbi:hypothetical protein BDP27DRAFT_1230085 [Rhodocollybia butyracea]|uniref:DUF6830 domain-containing protein n=1 Tax=Rhodocollybia butyracea TaxID=206335 RepID=A0A9P5U3A2_9AGAR|nr:hypothetical protein BDP27DRAFT_1230085 [Rhodocollybia butyracea]
MAHDEDTEEDKSEEDTTALILDVAKLGKKRQTQVKRAPTANAASKVETQSGSELLQTNIRIAKHPHEQRKSLNAIVNSHNVPGFIPALKLYINSHLPKEEQATKKEAIANGCLPFTLLDVWHHFKFTPVNLFDDDSDVPKEIVKAIPSGTNLRTSQSGPRYDTVIVLVNDEAESTAVIGCRVARLRVIFQLPEKVKRLGQGFGILEEPAPSNWPRTPLAYITWFSHFKSGPDSKNGMCHVKPSALNGIPQGGIISLSDIRQSCMLVPSSNEWSRSWISDNILDECPSFFVNNFQSKYTYQTIY